MPPVGKWRPLRASDWEAIIPSVPDIACPGMPLTHSGRQKVGGPFGEAQNPGAPPDEQMTLPIASGVAMHWYFIVPHSFIAALR